MITWFIPVLLIGIILGTWAISFQRWATQSEHRIFGNMSTGGALAVFIFLLIFYLPMKMWGLKGLALDSIWITLLVGVGLWLTGIWAEERWDRNHPKEQ